ncbi:hypothetical protein, partial [Escherichia coli]
GVYCVNGARRCPLIVAWPVRWWKKPEIYSIKKPAGLLRQVMAHAEENVVVMTNFLSDFNASIQFEITEPELQYML